MNLDNISESPINMNDIWKRLARFQPSEKLDIVGSITPLLIAFSGLVTFIALILGYLYLERRAVHDAVEETDQVARAREEGDGEEVEEDFEEDFEEEDKLGEGIGPWPTDGPAAACLREPNEALSEKERDALAFCGHIPAQIKKAQVKATMKKIEQDMTDEQKEKENEVQRQQLEAIFALMEDQKEKFGVDSVDDMNDQIRLYM